MSQLFRTRYRIVRDRWLGYEVQFRWWWMPFYVQGRTNTHVSVRQAEEYVEFLRKGPVVKYI